MPQQSDRNAEGPFFNSPGPNSSQPTGGPGPQAAGLSLFIDTIANEFGFGDNEAGLRANLHGFVEVSNTVTHKTVAMF
jgi:hypothetical protein